MLRIFTILTLCIIYSCSKSPKNKSSKTNEVVAFRVGQKTEITDPVIFAGFVQSKSQRRISAEINGSLLQLLVAPGEDVKVGDVIARVAPVASVGLDYQIHTVRSPIAGVVLAIAENLVSGAALTVGDHLLTVGDPQRIEVEFQAATEDLAAIAGGKYISVMQDDDVINPDIHAVIKSQSKAVDPRYGTVAVKADVSCRISPNDEKRKSGASCKLPLVGSYIRLLGGKNPRSGFLLPQAALQFDKERVYLLKDKAESVMQKNIKVVETFDDGWVLVGKGLREGDLIVESAE